MLGLGLLLVLLGLGGFVLSFLGRELMLLS